MQLSIEEVWKILWLWMQPEWHVLKTTFCSIVMTSYSKCVACYTQCKTNLASRVKLSWYHTLENYNKCFPDRPSVVYARETYQVSLL